MSNKQLNKQEISNAVNCVKEKAGTVRKNIMQVGVEMGCGFAPDDHCSDCCSEESTLKLN